MRGRIWRLTAIVTVLVLGAAAAGNAATRYVNSGPIRDADIMLRYPSRWQDVTKKVLAQADDDNTRRIRFIAGHEGPDVASLVARTRATARHSVLCGSRRLPHQERLAVLRTPR